MKSISFATLGLLMLTGCGSDHKQKLDACVNKGVAYFRAIDAYPTLSNGRKAEDVALERCRRTIGAFDH